MSCITCFKINVAALDENEVFEIIDLIGPDAGITDNFLYYGMLKQDTDDPDYKLYNQLHETLSIVYSKKEILKKIKNLYPISYIVDVKFSDIEYEIQNNTSFTISQEAKEFMEYIDCYYNLQNGYFD